MTKHTCRARGCTTQTQYAYCRIHRKANAKKARARRQSTARVRPGQGSSLAPATGRAAPTASEAFYVDQAARRTEPVNPVSAD